MYVGNVGMYAGSVCMYVGSVCMRVRLFVIIITYFVRFPRIPQYISCVVMGYVGDIGKATHLYFCIGTLGIRSG